MYGYLMLLPFLIFIICANIAPVFERFPGLIIFTIIAIILGIVENQQQKKMG